MSCVETDQRANEYRENQKEIYTMATKAERKRQKKQRREAKKAAKRNEYNQLARTIAQKLSQYPEIIFDESEGTPEFVAAVRKAQRDIDLDDDEVCPEPWRIAYRLIREAGYQAVLDWRRESVADGWYSDEDMDIDAHLFMLHYGSQLFDRIPLETRQRLLPYNDLRIRPAGNCLLLSFSSLLQKPGKGGTIFYSRRRPTVTLGGYAWPVGFSRHSIDQAVMRLNPDYCKYSCSLDVHSFFANCVYLEPAELDSQKHPRQQAFSMFDVCNDPTFQTYRIYVDEVFGLQGSEPDRSAGKFHFRLGYFPVEIDNGFAKAVSFLRPGYSGTPELRTLLKADGIDRVHKASLLRDARENKSHEVLLEGRTEVIKWFHKHAVPQVKQFADVVFDYSATKQPVFVRSSSLKERVKRHLGRPLAQV
jgi:hypothetical protein